MRDITIGVGVDISQGLTDLDRLQQAVDEKKRAVDKVVMEGMKQLRLLQRSLRMSFGLLRGLAKAFGANLPPILDAVVASIDMTIATVLAIAAIHAAVPGSGWMIAGAISAFALGWGIAARMDMSRRADSIERRIDGISQMLNSLSNIVSFGVTGGTF